MLLSIVSSEMTWENGDEDGDATLVCPFAYTMQWITPTELVVNPNTTGGKYFFDSYNSSLLKITKLNASDAGIYICGIPVTTEEKTSEDHMVRKIELYVKLPYHDSYYGDNAITGVVVAAIVALIFGGSCLLYKYRYREKQAFTDMEVVSVDSHLTKKSIPAEELPQKTDSHPILQHRRSAEGCENPALDASDSESDSDDDSKKKIKEQESLAMDVTTEQEQKRSSDTEETGM